MLPSKLYSDGTVQDCDREEWELLSVAQYLQGEWVADVEWNMFDVVGIVVLKVLLRKKEQNFAQTCTNIDLQSAQVFDRLDRQVFGQRICLLYFPFPL